MNQLDGAVVVVTGASAGVGRATARAFAEQGARLALLARGSVGLEAAADDVRRAGGSVVAIPVDVSSAAQVTEAAERIEIELGPIDVWVNNAMTSVFAPFWDVEPDEFRHVTEVCYLGCVYGTQAALRSMRSRDTGVVIQVGSALAYRGIPLQSAYCGAKHAIQGFTESVRCELLDDGSNVRLTMVQLPAMNTPQFDWALSRLPEAAQPVPPIYQPEVAAEAIVHAALHPHRREHWVGGSTASRPAFWTGISAGRACGRSRPANRTGGPAATCGRRWTGRAGATSARTGGSTPGPPIAVCRPRWLAIRSP
jgi:NAD(P)-dependent dehydrogenase (short-subunit alcohol dehydrogenase family)